MGKDGMEAQKNWKGKEGGSGRHHTRWLLDMYAAVMVFNPSRLIFCSTKGCQPGPKGTMLAREWFRVIQRPLLVLS